MHLVIISQGSVRLGKKKNGNGNGGNSASHRIFKIGCPRCGGFSKPVNAYPIYGALYRTETKKQDLCLYCGNEFSNLIKDVQNAILRTHKPRYEGTLKLFLQNREKELNVLSSWAPNPNYKHNGIIKYFQPEGDQATICPKCGEEKHLTRHHVFKSFVFGNDGVIIWFCRDCHNDLELLISRMEVFTLKPYKTVYELMHSEFMEKADEQLNAADVISSCKAAGIKMLAN